MNENLPSTSTLAVGRWKKKFACALRGVAIGARDQNSFYVHVPVAVVVLGLAWWLNVPSHEWAILVLCIAIVVSAELFNSAIEHMARAITRDTNPEVRDALDAASGAVLVVSIGAAASGLILLLMPLCKILFAS